METGVTLMNEGRSGTEQKSWLEKLSLALLGEPEDRDALLEMLRDAQQRNLLDAKIGKPCLPFALPRAWGERSRNHPRGPRETGHPQRKVDGVAHSSGRSNLDCQRLVQKAE